MSSLREQLRALHAQPGVGAVIAAGRDGLLIDHAPDGVVGDAEHLAALAPGLVAAADRLADAHAAGVLRSVVVETADGILIALPVSPDVVILAAIDPAHAAAAAAIGHVRGEHAALGAAV